MRPPSVKKILETMNVRSKHSIEIASQWDESLPTAKAIVEMKFILNAYNWIWRWHGFDSNLFLRSSVSRPEVEAQLQAACNVFMDNPIMAIQAAFSLAPGKTGSSKALATTRMVMYGLSPFKVLYKGRHVSLLSAFLISKKCDRCPSLRLSCDTCCFSDGEIRTVEDALRKWVSILIHDDSLSKCTQKKIYDLLVSDERRCYDQKKKCD